MEEASDLSSDRLLNECMVFEFLHVLKPFHWYLQLAVVQKVVSTRNPESYANSISAAGSFSQASQIKRVGNKP